LYHKGDVLAFAVDSTTTGAAIVTGYIREADDSTHIWYELVCTDYVGKQAPIIEQIRQRRLFGRKVASSLDPSGYFVGLDLESVRNDCFAENAVQFHLVGHLPLDTASIKLGSQGATHNYKEFIAAFHRGQEQRQLPPDHYSEIFKQEKFRPDEYFPVSAFLRR
jgi:hypothetical protein